MPGPLSRRDFAAALAAGSLIGAGEERTPLRAPKPPTPDGSGTRADLLFETLLGEFPETRVAAQRDAIVRQIATNLYHGRQLAEANLTNADGPGPLWAAYRADEEEETGE